MEASVIVNVHAGSKVEFITAAIDSILTQNHPEFELIVVVSAAPDLRDPLEERFEDEPLIDFVVQEEDRGLSAARNEGAEAADGEIVVFTDDDVITDDDWLSELCRIYDAEPATGVGGLVEPLWPSSRPRYLPQEFDWLVGVTHYPISTIDSPTEMRNTFGCNISFRRDEFLSAGGFREDLGKQGGQPLQGEEAEATERIDGSFWYVPSARVRHRVEPHQLRPMYLLRRSFWQGYSKAALNRNQTEEASFLRVLFTDSMPKRLLKPSLQNFVELGSIVVLTGSVGMGYVWGRAKSAISEIT